MTTCRATREAVYELIDIGDVCPICDRPAIEHKPEGDPTIVCRAKLAEGCLDGQPTSRQFGESLPMDNDNTYERDLDGIHASIVCDACYELLMPFTKSGAALLEELPEAIAHVREQIAFLRGHDDPAVLLAEAEKMAGDTSPGTPMHDSASAAATLARREIERRGKADGSNE